MCLAQLVGSRRQTGGHPPSVDGTFSFDEKNPEASKIKVTLKTASVDTNHAERDKHIKSGDFLNVSKNPTATFESTSVKSTGEGTADVTGNLTLNGVTKPVVINAKFVGQGDDPWGGYRAGFEGTTTIKLKDFDIQKDLGPASQEAQSLANEVNQKRRQAYEEIAGRNRTQLETVEALAAEKAIQNTKPGHFVEGPGGWVRK